MDVLGALMSVRATLGSRWKGLFLSIFSQAPQAELASVPAQSSPNYEARLTTERQAVDVIDWANMLSTAALHCAYLTCPAAHFTRMRSVQDARAAVRGG